MEIPNTLITIRCHNGLTRGPLIYPAYVANVLRHVYANMLDITAPGKGIEVAAFPEDGDPSMRYREVFGVDQEIGWLRRLYGPSKGPTHVDAVWNEESLKKELERILVEEAARMRNAAKPKAVIAANPTFLAFGLTEDQARSLQAAGYPDRASCVGQSLVDLASVHKISIDIAGRLAEPDAKAEAKK